MTLEDFTTYTEVEPDDRIQVTPNNINIRHIDQEDSYVYKDLGVDYFAGDFEHLFEFVIHVMATGTQCWANALTNVVDDLYNVRQANDLLGVRFDRAGAGYRVILYETVAGASAIDQHSGLALFTRYFVRFKRDEAVGTYGTLYCDVYPTEADRTNEANAVCNLTLTLREKEDFRYCFACSSIDEGSAIEGRSQIANLDIGIDVITKCAVVGIF